MCPRLITIRVCLFGTVSACRQTYGRQCESSTTANGYWMIAFAAWHLCLSLTLLVSDATVDARCGPMIGMHQTAEKLFPHLPKVGAAKVTEQFHPIETVSPSVEHFGAGRSAEGEFLIRKRQNLRHSEPRPLQMTFRFAAHMESRTVRPRAHLPRRPGTRPSPDH